MLVMALLPRLPPPADHRRARAARSPARSSSRSLALVIFILCFTPVPIEMLCESDAGSPSRATVTDTGSTSTIVRRLRSGRSSSAAAQRLAHRARCVPLRKNCARYSSLIFDSAAGAGPRTRPMPGRGARARPDRARRSSRASSVRPLHDDVDQRRSPADSAGSRGTPSRARRTSRSPAPAAARTL